MEIQADQSLTNWDFDLFFGVSVPALTALVVLAAAIIALYLLTTRRKNTPTQPNHEPILTMVFDGETVTEFSGEFAREMDLPTPDSLKSLLALFNPAEDHLESSIRYLLSDGKRFDEVALATSGDLVHVTGQTTGLFAKISVFSSSPISEALYEIQSQLEALMEERDRLRRRLSNVPMAMLELDEDKREIWANRHFRTLCDQVRSSEELIKLMKTQSNKPVEVSLPGSGESHWLRIIHRQSDGHTVVSAYPADEQHRAEVNLIRFRASLTDTFANLKVGLAVFNNERKLSLFNPALSEIFGIDVNLLISNPSLREFLEAIRQKRMVPEMRDFAQWRDQITAIDDTLDDGSILEEWSLPSGQVLQVAVRSHPDGALALMFEDITSSVTLERRYRAEIEIGHATLDSLPDSVAVFDTSGAMVYANSAFEEMWEIDETSVMDTPSLKEMTKVFTKSTASPETWEKVRRFAQSSDKARETWTVEFKLKDDGLRFARFSILPGGATMMLFRDHGGRVGDNTPSNVHEFPMVPLKSAP